MNIQGVHWVTDLWICNLFSPLTTLFDMVLFLLKGTNLTRPCTKQMASSASLKCGRSSDPVLHSVNKTHKKETLSTSNQIPEHIYTHFINQNQELLIDIVTILFPYRSILLIVHSHRLLTWRGRGSVHFLNTAYLLVCSLSTFSLVDLSSDILIS